MAGSANWLSLDDAQAHIACAASAINQTERVALQQAQGRVLAADVTATLNVPPWDNAAMDGYAIALEDACDAPLAIQGTITAGQSAITSLEAGKCLRIMTGAPLPPGADTVVMQENVQISDGGIRLSQTPERGENIRRCGNDVARGDVLITQGTRLNAAHLMVLASQGVDQVTVIRNVRVGVVTTGDELVAPGGHLSDGQIFDANRTGIMALLASLPVTVTDYGIVKDDPAQLKKLFSEVSQTQDVVISSGGVSVGDADYVKSVLAESGDVEFWKVAIKPGKPFAFGKLGRTLFCGVPGNPVSAYVTTQMLVLPLIERLSGKQQSAGITGFDAILSTPVRRRAGRLEFMRAYYQKDIDQGLRVTPLSRQSSAVMTSVTEANCYLIVDADTDTIEPGSQVRILPFTQSGLM